MTKYGGPEHALQDGYGNKRSGVKVDVYATEADAMARSNPLASLTSTSSGPVGRRTSCRRGVGPGAGLPRTASDRAGARSGSRRRRGRQG